MAMACLHLAGKVEEAPKKLATVCQTMHGLQHRSNGGGMVQLQEKSKVCVNFGTSTMAHTTVLMFRLARRTW
jgi:hypothetical protein